MRKKLLVTFSTLALAVAAVLLWSAPGYNINRVLPSLRALATPYQSVDTTYYLDGGSIGLTIVDRDGDRLVLTLPVSPGNMPDFLQLFIGGPYSYDRPGAVEVEFTKDTRRMLVSIMEQYPPLPENGGASLEFLRRSPRDYVTMGINALHNLLR